MMIMEEKGKEKSDVQQNNTIDDLLVFKEMSTNINITMMNNESYHNITTKDEFLLRANMLGDDEDENANIPLNCFLLFILVAICYAMKPNIPDSSHHNGLIFRETLRKREEKKKDPERRKRFVQASLITKRVIACHEENKALRLGDATGSIAPSMTSFSVNSLEDENVSSCVICLEPFQKGDIVTFPKNSEECRHVFHQECLEEWLCNPKHDDCPYCRCQIIDDMGDENEPYEEEPMSSSQLAYVIMNGLISPLRRASASLIGSSINFEDHDDDDSSTYSARSLKRVISFGSLSDALGKRQLEAIFRRVSSGLSLHRDDDGNNSSFDDLGDNSSKKERRNRNRRMQRLKEPESLRRCSSEGLHTATRLGRKASSGSSSSSPRVFRRSSLSYESIESQQYSHNIGDNDNKDVIIMPSSSYIIDEDSAKKLSPIQTTLPAFSLNFAEEVGATPRTNNYQRLDPTESDDDDQFNINKLPIELELEFGDDNNNNCKIPKSLPKPRMSFTFNRASGSAYSKLFSNPIDANNSSDEEESLLSFSAGQEEDGNSIESIA